MNIELENGFLDDKMSIIINDIKEKYKNEFKLLNSFNELCYKIISNYKDLEITQKNNELSYLLPAFVEIHKQFQSAIIMLEYGFANNFESILRNIFELSFQMLYVFKNSNNMFRLEKHTYSQTMKKLEYIDDNKLYDIIPKVLLDSQYNEIKKQKEILKNKGVKNSPEIQDMCKELDLKREYTYYRYLSDYVHCDFSVIMSLNIFCEDGVMVNAQGDYNNFTNNVFRLIYSIELVIGKMINKIAPSLENEHKKVVSEFNQYVKKNKER